MQKERERRSFSPHPSNGVYAYLCCAFRPDSLAWTVTRFNWAKYVNVSSPMFSARGNEKKSVRDESAEDESNDE